MSSAIPRVRMSHRQPRHRRNISREVSNSNEAHVRRVLRFGYLAPDIVGAIAEGRQPRCMTVQRLLSRNTSGWLHAVACLPICHDDAKNETRDSSRGFCHEHEVTRSGEQDQRNFTAGGSFSKSKLWPGTRIGWCSFSSFGAAAASRHCPQLERGDAQCDVDGNRTLHRDRL